MINVCVYISITISINSVKKELLCLIYKRGYWGLKKEKPQVRTADNWGNVKLSKSV